MSDVQVVNAERTGGFPCVVAALDVGGTKIAGALVRYVTPDAAPTVEARRSVPTEAARGGAAVLETLSALTGELVAVAAGEGQGVVGVGVGTAGRVDARTGAIAYASEIMPGWTGQPVAAHLRKVLCLPVAVLNDVQAHALGEARWGAAQGADTCLMVAAGTGLGGAIIAHGRVLRGAHGFAGEVGHTLSPDATGVRCVCGGTSHLESVASGSGIEERYRAAGGEALSGAEIAKRAAAGDELARQVIMLAGSSLGEAIAGWASMLDPELVVLAGSVLNAGPLWRDALHAGYARQTPETLRSLPLVDAQLKGDAPLIGAAENLLDFLGARD